MLSAIVMLMPPVLQVPSAALPNALPLTVTRSRLTCAVPPDCGLITMPPPVPEPMLLITVSVTLSLLAPFGRNLIPAWPDTLLLVITHLTTCNCPPDVNVMPPRPLKCSPSSVTTSLGPARTLIQRPTIAQIVDPPAP